MINFDEKRRHNTAINIFTIHFSTSFSLKTFSFHSGPSRDESIHHQGLFNLPVESPSDVGTNRLHQNKSPTGKRPFSIWISVDNMIILLILQLIEMYVNMSNLIKMNPVITNAYCNECRVPAGKFQLIAKVVAKCIFHSHIKEKHRLSHFDFRHFF